MFYNGFLLQPFIGFLHNLFLVRQRQESGSYSSAVFPLTERQFIMCKNPRYDLQADKYLVIL
jgi:hypothetical protein